MINVGLTFTANTASAKNALQSLQNQLTQIASGVNLNINDASVKAGIVAAKELSMHLKNATNVNTGKIDLSKLNTGLKSSGQSLSQLSTQMVALGPQGQQAFVQMGQAISQAERPVFRLQGAVGSLWKTLKTAVGYRIAYGAINAITSSIREAIHFAKDLNRSLTDIRIVTDYSAEEMDRFAKNANEAAKALSTTTVAFTDASLIYFQQGLDMAEAQKRAEVTVKMANVTGQSVEEVSDQLTAIWNNFYDGSESLESFADKLTALGAATASSTDEIATGLEKFAAIGETVGLSFDYAATALATITATTRQSADTVGTALKTLFARIQDLELGNTLDDGTTMGQYSQALMSVGINIKEQNGQLKDMDKILNEMGNKWDTLSKDQQAALAQNVAGIRQYTQLIALMDNWDYFEENLDVTQGSSGELERQQEKYAESWEAASQRMTATTEDLFMTLLNDDFFISFIEGLTEVIKGVDDFMERIGGLKAFLLPLGALIANMFISKIEPAISKTLVTLNSFTAAGAMKAYTAAAKDFNSAAALNQSKFSPSQNVNLDATRIMLAEKEKYYSMESSLSAVEKQRAQNNLHLLGIHQDIVGAAAQEYNLALNQLAELKAEIDQEKILQELKQGQITAEDQASKKKQDQKKKLEELISLQEQYKQKTEESNFYKEKMNKAGSSKEKVQYGALAAHAQEEAFKLQAAFQFKAKGMRYNIDSDLEKPMERVDSKIAEQQEAKAAAINKVVESYLSLAKAAKDAQSAEKVLTGNASTITAGLNPAQVKGKTAADVGEEMYGSMLQNKRDLAQTGAFDSKTMQKAQGYLTAFKKEIQGLDGSASSFKQLQAAFNKLENKLKGVGLSAEDVRKALSSMGGAPQKAVDGARQAVEKVGQTSEKAKAALQGMKEAAAQVNMPHQNTMADGLKHFTSAIGKASSALMGLQSLVTTFQNGFDPTNLSSWVSLLMGLGMILPLLSQGFTAITGKMAAYHSAVAAGTLIEKTNMLVKEQDSAVTLANAVATEFGLTASQEAALAESLNTIATQGGANAKEKQVAAIIKAVTGKEIDTVQTDANTAAELRNIAVKAWWIALIILIIALLAMLVIALVNQETAAEKAAKSLAAQTEALEKLNESLEESKQKLDEMKDKIEEIKELENAFDNLIKGTDEWYENLNKANDQILEIIKKYPDLVAMGAISFQNGRYAVVDPKLLEAYLLGQSTIDVIMKSAMVGMQTIRTSQANFDYKWTYGREGEKKKEILTDLNTTIDLNDFAGYFMTGEFTTGSREDTKRTDYEGLGLATHVFDLENYQTYQPFNEYITWKNFTGDEGEKEFEETINKASKDIWEKLLLNGQDLDQAVQEVITADKFGTAVDSLTDYFTEVYTEVIKKTEGSLEEFNMLISQQNGEMIQLIRERETTNNALAASIVNSHVEFQDLSSAQVEAAQVLLGQQIARIEAMIPDFDVGEGLSDGMYELGQFLKVITQNYRGLDKDDEVIASFENEWYDSDWFEWGNADIAEAFEDTKAGHYIMEQYVNSQDWGFKWGDSFEITYEGMRANFVGSDGDDHWVSYSEMIYHYILDTIGIYNDEQMEQLSKHIQNMEAATLAMITQNFQYLTKEEMKIIADYNKETGRFEVKQEALQEGFLNKYFLGWDLDEDGKMDITGLTGYSDMDKKKDEAKYLEEGKVEIQVTKDGEQQLFNEDGTLKSAQELKMSDEAYGELEAAWIAYSSTTAAQVAAYDPELENTKKLMQEENEAKNLLNQAAEQYDLNAEILRRYAKTLEDGGKVAAKVAAQQAIANAKFSKGLDMLRDKLEENIEVLKEYDEKSWEFAEAAAEIGEALELMFGIAVDDNRIKEWADDGILEKLAGGGEEAIETFRELEETVAIDYIWDLAIDDKYKSQIEEMINYLSSQEDNLSLDPTITFNDQDYIQSLNKLLKEGLLTVDQVNAMFNSIGWSPDIDYHTEWVDDVAYQASGTVTNPNADIQDWETDSLTWTKIITKSSMTIPSIGSATYTPKNYSSASQPPKSSSSGGGGSKKEKKKKSDEIERYHEIKEVLNDLEREYDQISKAKDRAFGQKRLDWLDKEITKQEELNAANEEYLRQIDENLEIDKQTIADKYGASFDDRGRITNWEEIMNVNLDAYNKAVEDFNAGRISEGEFEGREQAYEQMKEDLAQYEETLNDREDLWAEHLDGINAEADLKLEEIEYSMELKISLSEDSLALIEYFLNKLEDEAYAAAESLAYLSKGIDATVSNMKAYQDSIRDNLKLSGFTDEDVDYMFANPDSIETMIQGKELTEAQVEALREARDGLLESNEAMREYKEQAIEKLESAFEELNEDMAKNNELIEHQKSILTSYKDIIELIGKQEGLISNELVKEMDRANVQLSADSIKNAKTVLETRQALYDQAEVEYQKAIESGNEESIKVWEDQLETLGESVREARQDLSSEWQEGLQTAVDAFQAEVERVIDIFEKAMTGIHGSFEYFEEAYNRSKEVSDRHLKDYEKIYNLTKLNRDITKSIDENDSLRAKEALRDLQEETNALAESEAEITQFQVDELRARYELRLAEIALEEAQNAKSQVRMQRDSEGNWSYVYTADQDNIASAEQNYEDKLYNLQKTTQERVREIEDQLLSLPRTMAEAIQKIQMDTTLSEEEKEAKITETRDYYVGLYNYWLEQLGFATMRSSALYDSDWTSYAEKTGYKISKEEEWLDKWSETTYAQLTGFDSLETAQSAFLENTDIMVSGLAEAYEQWQNDVENMFSSAEASISSFGAQVIKVIEGAEEASQKAVEATEKLGASGIASFQTLYEEASGFLTKYSKIMGQYETQNEQLANSVNNIVNTYANLTSPLEDLWKKLEEITNQAIEATAAIVKMMGAGGNEVGSYPEIPSTKPEGLLEKPHGNNTQQTTTEKTYAAQYYAYDKDTRQWKKTVDNSGTTYKDKNAAIARAKDLFEKEWTKRNKLYKEEKGVFLASDHPVYRTYSRASTAYLVTGNEPVGNKQETIGNMQKFDTGGYTGEWDSSGRIAMLHQKEIVLNAHDTENFLSAISLLHQITSSLDLQTALTRQSYSSALYATRVLHDNNAGIDQNIVIHAEFPSATDRNEIQEAFNSLFIRASQFANRKN